jgi:hypothetical protein
MQAITCFIPCPSINDIKPLISSLQQNLLVEKIVLLVENLFPEEPGISQLVVDAPFSTETIKRIANETSTPYILYVLHPTISEPGQFALERMTSIASSTNAGMVYADYYKVSKSQRHNNPVNDYQEGSVRDDFDFGPVLLLEAALVRNFTKNRGAKYQYAGLYDLRLFISETSLILHINEYLFTDVETDNRKSGEKQFDYVNPKNRQVQIEMEQACTTHLKAIGAWLKPDFEEITFEVHEFPVEASVIIPVMNRVKTIEDAIRSVLIQNTDFQFNLIIIDNYSTDGTSELIDKYVRADKRVIHLIPERKDLGIGGCWNEGIHSSFCGKFAVQLDSDDVYQDENTLQMMVNAFYEQQCGMVVGSYTMTNFRMETIPPGLIDHKEWTPDNGRNNALRINGLGAPRAFYTPLLRSIKVPNTSYGEDYALGLAIGRHYRIGRVYESVYLCRRWDENSDASLDVQKMNAHNAYKDKLRTIEIKARQKMNKNMEHK